MDVVLYILGGSLLIVSLAAHFYVKLRLRPRADSDLDDYYYEFEEQHPTYARYLKWSRITFAGVTIAVLLLFITAVI